MNLPFYFWHLAAMGGIFTLGECIAEDIRGEDDAINAGIGGCAAGLAAGIRSKYSDTIVIDHNGEGFWYWFLLPPSPFVFLTAHSIAKMCAACAGIGGTMYAYEYSGQLKGNLHGKSAAERKEIRDSFFKDHKSPATEE